MDGCYVVVFEGLFKVQLIFCMVWMMLGFSFLCSWWICILMVLFVMFLFQLYRCCWMVLCLSGLLCCFMSSFNRVNFLWVRFSVCFFQIVVRWVGFRYSVLVFRVGVVCFMLWWSRVWMWVSSLGVLNGLFRQLFVFMFSFRVWLVVCLWVLRIRMGMLLFVVCIFWMILILFSCGKFRLRMIRLMLLLLMVVSVVVLFCIQFMVQVVWCRVVWMFLFSDVLFLVSRMCMQVVLLFWIYLVRWVWIFLSLVDVLVCCLVLVMLWLGWVGVVSVFLKVVWVLCQFFWLCRKLLQKQLVLILVGLMINFFFSMVVVVLLLLNFSGYLGIWQQRVFRLVQVVFCSVLGFIFRVVLKFVCVCLIRLSVFMFFFLSVRLERMIFFQISVLVFCGLVCWVFVV